MAALDEWYAEIRKGSHEDMVYDILGDWQKDRELFLGRVEKLEKEIKNILKEVSDG